MLGNNIIIMDILKDEEAVLESIINGVFWSLKMAKKIRNIYIFALFLLWSPAINIWQFTKANMALFCLFLMFCFED